jgi:hypothetical protein
MEGVVSFTLRPFCARVPIGQEAGWVPEPVWTLWRTENLAPVGNRTAAVQLIARRCTAGA